MANAHGGVNARSNAIVDWFDSIAYLPFRLLPIRRWAALADQGTVCIQDIYLGIMSIDHDPTKARANLRKHGILFADAEGVLHDPLALTIEDIDAVGERRATRKERKTYEA